MKVIGNPILSFKDRILNYKHDSIRTISYFGMPIIQNSIKLESDNVNSSNQIFELNTNYELS